MSDLTIEFSGAVTVAGPKLQSDGKAAEEKLRELLGEAADAFIDTRKARDGGVFHITVMTPPEMRQVTEARVAEERKVDPTFSKNKAGEKVKLELQARIAASNLSADWRVEGIGRAEGGGHETYFVVLDWPGGKRMRHEFGLDPNRDFHMTIGFRGGDVHGVKKDRSTLIRDASVALRVAARFSRR